MSDPSDLLRGYLHDNEIEYDEPQPGLFSFALPGEKKLQTPVRLDVGGHALGVHAFVCRRPDENHEGVHAWLLQKNLRMFAVSFALDRLGDIYLDARLPLSVVNADDLDHLLGSVLTAADESFNTILELGFASSIRKEWDWRKLRGESTKNLEAFRGWLERDSHVESAGDPAPARDSAGDSARDSARDSAGDSAGHEDEQEGDERR